MVDFQEIFYITNVVPLVFYHIVEAGEDKQLNTSPHLKARCSTCVLLHASLPQLTSFTKWANIFSNVPFQHEI